MAQPSEQIRAEISRFPERGPERLRAVVAIPALDEARTVAAVVRAIPKTLPGVAQIDVLVVDDGSSDATAEEARRAGAHVIRHPRRLGVGAAFTTALRFAVDDGADLMISIDADGQFDPADIEALVRPVIQGEADFATASRFIDPALEPEMPSAKRWGNRMMARLISGLAGQKLHDVSCGMRCYGRRAILTLNPMANFTYTQEVILNLAFKQLRIVEVPVRVRGEREFGESRVAGNLWTYAVYTSSIIFRCYRDYRPLRFFGGLALLFGVPGALLLAFLSVHYVVTGSFSPYKWTGFGGASLAFLALLVLGIGILGDMLNRHRMYLEELLVRQRGRRESDRLAPQAHPQAHPESDATEPR